MDDRGVTLVLTAVQQDMAPFSEIISSCARAPGNRWGQWSVAGHNQNTGLILQGCMLEWRHSCSL